MNSFQEIAKKKGEDLLKASKKGFAQSKGNTARAIGGASPASTTAISRIASIEENIGENGGTLDTRLDGIDATTTSHANNISSLDAAATSLSGTVSALSGTVSALSTVVDDKAPAIHSHITDHLNSAQVRALVALILGEEGLTSIPVGNPTIVSGQYGSDFTYSPEWGDTFLDADAETLFNRWHPDLMTEGLHQAGNSGEDGWRWSAQYSQPEETSFIRNNSLHMRAKVDNVANPFRKAYTFRGETMNPQDHKIYLSFLTTWAREYDNGAGYHITSPSAPNRTWGPSTAFEFTVDLSEMRTQACRISFYLLPAYENDSNSYTPDGTIGIENDITEVDFLDGYENHSQSKVISSLAASTTPSGDIDLNTIIAGLDLTAGEHTFTLLWAKDRFVWYVDGIEIQRDTDPRRIPQVPHYLVISREANSGIKAEREDEVLFDDEDAFSDGTLLMPQDTGIWARPVYKEIDKLNNDTARIVSFKSFSFIDNSSAGIGVGDDTTGLSPTMVSADPPTSWTALTTHQFSWNPNGRTIADWYFELGSSRGGRELGNASGTGAVTDATIQVGYVYSGPVNGRLWFREDANSVWHWRDYGFSSGLQAYYIGTDGEIGVTVPVGTGTTSLPTVAGVGNLGVDLGTDGTFAATIDYSGGVIPAGYAEGYNPTLLGVVGQAPPAYTGGSTLSAINSLSFNQYPNTTGELLWSQPGGFDALVDKYELTIDNVIVLRENANSFFVTGYPAGAMIASVRLVREDGSYGDLNTLNFTMVTV